MYPNTTARQVKCGHCSSFNRPVYHDTIAEVRDHSKPKPVAAPATRSAAPVKIQKMATEGQINYITGLATKRDTSTASGAARTTMERVLAGTAVTFADASAAIDSLKLCQYKEDAPTEATRNADQDRKELADLLAKVPNGRYAVDIDGKVHFYVVKDAKNLSGRKYRTVKEKASEQLYRMYRPQQIAALRKIIEAGLEAAGLLYATTLSECRRCGRELTDTDNPYKVYGYGPDCGPKVMGG